jgi:hypothetical protein
VVPVRLTLRDVEMPYPGANILLKVPLGATWKKSTLGYQKIKQKKPGCLTRQPGYLLPDEETRGFPSPARTGFGALLVNVFKTKY